MEQVVENVDIADRAVPGMLTSEDQALYDKVREVYNELKPVPCTGCRGCMPCPQGIDVPRIFELYNDAIMYGDDETARSIYRIERHRIDDCNECGACANACGREIAIMDWLKKARKLLAEND